MFVLYPPALSLPEPAAEVGGGGSPGGQERRWPRLAAEEAHAQRRGLGLARAALLPETAGVVGQSEGLAGAAGGHGSGKALHFTRSGQVVKVMPCDCYVIVQKAGILTTMTYAWGAPKHRTVVPFPHPTVYKCRHDKGMLFQSPSKLSCCQATGRESFESVKTFGFASRAFVGGFANQPGRLSMLAGSGHITHFMG